jgi:hypothetical protein
VITKLGPLVPLAVAVLILVLVLTAFGLGFIWGRGRRAPTSGGEAAKE